MHNALKAKLQRGEATIGTWHMIGHPAISEILAQPLAPAMQSKYAVFIIFPQSIKSHVVLRIYPKIRSKPRLGAFPALEDGG